MTQSVYSHKATPTARSRIPIERDTLNARFLFGFDISVEPSKSFVHVNELCRDILETKNVLLFFAQIRRKILPATEVFPSEQTLPQPPRRLSQLLAPERAFVESQKCNVESHNSTLQAYLPSSLR